MKLTICYFIFQTIPFVWKKYEYFDYMHGKSIRVFIFLSNIKYFNKFQNNNF